MSWLFALVGLLIILAIILILSGSGNPVLPGSWGGPDKTPMCKEGPLPAWYDKKLGEAEATVREATRLSTSEALESYIGVRHHDSAVIELNIARALLDQLKNGQALITTESKKRVTNALDRADYLINQDQPDKQNTEQDKPQDKPYDYRYPVNIKERVEMLREELQNIG